GGLLGLPEDVVHLDEIRRAPVLGVFPALAACCAHRCHHLARTGTSGRRGADATTHAGAHPALRLSGSGGRAGTALVAGSRPYGTGHRPDARYLAADGSATAGPRPARACPNS